MSFNSKFGIGAFSTPASMVGWWLMDGSLTPQQGATFSVRTGSAATTTGPKTWLPNATDLKTNGLECRATTASLDQSSATIAYWIREMAGSYGAMSVNYGGQTAAVGISNNGSTNNGQRGCMVGGTYRQPASAIYGAWFDTWHFEAIATTPTETYIHGSNGTTNLVKHTEPLVVASQSTSDFRIGHREDWHNDVCHLANLVVWNETFSDADITEVFKGPELNYTSGATLVGDGSYNIGTWELPSPFNTYANGSPTYEVIAVNAAGTVLDTASTATGTLDLSANAGNTCYLLVRTSNTGGYDLGDFSTRTSNYGSLDDGYYEIASTTEGGGSGQTLRLIFFSS